MLGLLIQKNVLKLFNLKKQCFKFLVNQTQIMILQESWYINTQHEFSWFIVQAINLFTISNS